MLWGFNSEMILLSIHTICSDDDGTQCQQFSVHQTLEDKKKGKI